MNQQHLPNAQAVYILGIISIVGSCCTSGLLGFICGLIGMTLYGKDQRLFNENQSLYFSESFNKLQTGRTLCMIGIVFACFWIFVLIIIFLFYGMAASIEMLQNIFS